MLRVVWAGLRRRASRTVALLVGIVVAVSGFTVLTGSSQVERLQVHGTVAHNYRGVYDILVRPPGSKTKLERHTKRVTPNFLSGIYGGISKTQYHQIQHISRVKVAAPIAMVGYALPTVKVNVDLSRHLSSATRQMFRIRPVRHTDRGRTRIRVPPSYVYVTRHRLKWAGYAGAPAKEMLPGGHRVPVCKIPTTRPVHGGPFSASLQARNLLETGRQCWSTRNGHDGRDWNYPPLTGPVPRGHVGFGMRVSVPLLVAAIDPAAEAKLDHLDHAIVSGRYLHHGDNGYRPVPLLASSRNYLDDSTSVTVQRLPHQLAAAVLGGHVSRARENAAHGTTVGTRHINIGDAYHNLLHQMHRQSQYKDGQVAYWGVGPAHYRTRPDGELSPTPVHNPVSVWSALTSKFPWLAPPMDNSDTQFRSLHQHAGTEDAQRHQTFPTLHEVGQFDPAKLPNFGSLGRMALNAYAPPRTKPGDAAARKALSGHNLAPNSNLGGYVAQPPQLLTTLGAVGAFTRSAVFKPIANEGKPISVIRVRVAGVTGPNAVSRERVRTVAQQIHQRTGLDVDIMAGSSPSPQTLHLPAGKHGRPALQLDQNWTKKGVAATILHTLNRKNLVLFGLILLVCGLFVANAATAAVRARHTELGVLSCLGWSRPRLFATILTELAAIGFAGGILGGAITWPIATMTGLHPSLTQTALAVPIAVGLAVAAGIAPARRAAKASPAQALRPIARNPRRARRATGILSLAWSNLTRVPGRALLGAVTMAVGVFALTLLLAITLAFRGALVGTLLGHAISVQTQNIDYIAVALIIILAGLAVADVLYLAIRDRAAEFATLRATGWDETALARLVGYEATIIGAAGAITGAAAGLIGAAIFAGSLPPTLIGAAIAAAIIGTLVTIAAAILPASQLRRLPTTSVLAEE